VAFTAGTIRRTILHLYQRVSLALQTPIETWLVGSIAYWEIGTTTCTFAVFGGQIVS
jgi:hypothetical protein